MPRGSMMSSLRRLTPIDAVLAVYLPLCIVFGGASAAGVFANALLQLLAILALGFVLWRRDASATPIPRGPAILLAGVAALLLVQFLPLPPSIWAGLPGRARYAEGFSLLGMPIPWGAVSMAPGAALSSALGILPFLGALALTLYASSRGREVAIVLIGVFAGLSMLVGALQIATGVDSTWYFYAITNRSAAVGFFANRNHLATLFLIALPLLTGMFARARAGSGSHSAASAAWLYAGLAAFVAFGVVLTTSSAGIALLALGIALCVLLYRRALGKPLSPVVVFALLAIFVAAVLFLLFGPYGDRFIDKALSTSDSTTRRTSFALTLTAIRDFLPLGSGLGTFRTIYAGFENPLTVGNVFVNHAHNDWLEITLELGLPGLLVALALVAWLVRRTIQLWAGQQTNGTIARACTIAAGLVLCHSLVDYPLRTAAIAALFGFALACIAVPQPSRRQKNTAPAEDDEPVQRRFRAD